jgi:6-pyruvoyltetrahydropterin/6-carboxytetrahydropterin synthase
MYLWLVQAAVYNRDMIRLTREVRFSVDRDWAGHIEFARPVTNSWGGWPSAVGLVPYLRLRATVEGEPDARTGYVCNISVIDRVLREHAIPHAAEELARNGWRVSTETLLLAIWKQIRARVPPNTRLICLELSTTPMLRYTVEPAAEEASTVVQLTQQFEFSAAHRLHCPALSEDENRATFGKCNNPNGHGHNYLVEVTVAGVPDARTGAVLPLPRFEQIVKEYVIDVLDHTHLNLDTPQFRDVNPSVENIARIVWSMLADRVMPARLHAVRVWETPKTCAEYRG